MQNNKKYLLSFKKILFVLLISLTIFCGCQNDVQENTSSSNSTGKTLSVAVNFSNFPANNLTNSNSSRSAHPSAENLSSCVFKATITCGTETSVESTAPTPSDQKYIFSFPNLVNSAEKTYTLDVSVYSSDEKIATGTSSLTVLAFTENVNSSVTLKSLTTDGLPPGKVSLKLKLEDGLNDRIKKVFYEFINTDSSKNITGLSSSFTQDSTDSKYYATITIPSDKFIYAGVYSLNLKFTLESTETNIIYFRKETVNIWSGMTTDDWYLSQGTVSDVLEITKSMLFDTYYVCGTDSDFFTSILGADETGSDTDGDGSMAKPFATVQPALDKILAVNDGATEYTIYVGGMVRPSSVPNQALAYATDIDKNLKLNIVGITEDNKKNILDASLCYKKNLEFNIKSGSSVDVTVTIKNLSLTGAYGTFGGAVYGNADFIFDNVHAYGNESQYGGVIYSDGNVTLQNGTVFGNKDVTDAATYDNYSNYATYNSGAIRLANGTLTIKEGCYVSGNYCIGSSEDNAGGGISVQGTGKVILEKGAFVQYNTVETYGGGGIYLQKSGSSAEIYGTIQGNNAPDGGGIYANTETTVTLNGATISNNTATSSGGGIYATGTTTVNLTDTTISKNTASDGGGIYFTGTTLDIDAASIIGDSSNDSNTATNGAGIYIAGGTVNLKGTVAHNKASSKGGGIYIAGSQTLILDSTNLGSIKNNTAGTGGGIYIDSSGSFEMSAGEISNNTATSNGAGIYNADQLKVSGAAKIDSTNEVYLDTDTKVTITGALTQSEVATIEPSAYTEGITVLESESSTPDYVSSYCNLFNIAPEETGTNSWCISSSGKLAKAVTLSEAQTVLSGAAAGSEVELGVILNLDTDLLNLATSIANSPASSVKLILSEKGALTAISADNFKDNSKLKSIIIPNTITEIAAYAFKGCSSLDSVTIPSSVNSIGINVFQGCASLSNLNMNASITKLPTNIFMGCISLTEFKFPEKVTDICGLAFNGCTGLISITIPASVNKIEANAFSGCSNLTTVIFENHNGWGGEADFSDPFVNADTFKNGSLEYTRS